MHIFPDALLQRDHYTAHWESTVVARLWCKGSGHRNQTRAKLVNAYIVLKDFHIGLEANARTLNSSREGGSSVLTLFLCASGDSPK